MLNLLVMHQIFCDENIELLEIQVFLLSLSASLTDASTVFISLVCGIFYLFFILDNLIIAKCLSQCFTVFPNIDHNLLLAILCDFSMVTLLIWTSVCFSVMHTIVPVVCDCQWLVAVPRIGPKLSLLWTT